MIDGYLGQVLPDLCLGWAFDRDTPELHLVIDFYCGERLLGSTTADLYRPDLAMARIGEGDHAFSFHLPEPLLPGELGAVEARARRPDDPASVCVLRRYLPRPRAESARTGVSAPENTYSDDTQFPVFVLGAPRSGTSAIAQSLMSATPYTGYLEGQVLDLLAPLLHEVRRFYGAKAEELEHPERGTTILKVPEAYFDGGIKALFAAAVRPLFPDRHWCDKTPTPDMIWAAPDLLRMWPNAKFVFVRRRGLENLRSRLRKFPTTTFENQCLHWTACMEAWRSVREHLRGRALDLDQYFIAREPERTARAIGKLLSLADKDMGDLARVLRRHQPERSSANIQDTCDAQSLGWSEEQWATFERVCGPTMTAYGYSRDAAYFVPGAAANQCVVL